MLSNIIVGLALLAMTVYFFEIIFALRPITDVNVTTRVI